MVNKWGHCWRSKLAITEADRSDRSGPVIRVGLGFCVKSSIVTRFGRGTSSLAYKYKDYGRLRVFWQQSNQYNLFYSISQTLIFSNPFAVLCSSLRRSRASWVAYRPQNNPRSSSSDGVPPELEVSRFSRDFYSNRSDRLSQAVWLVLREVSLVTIVAIRAF